jgi:hypothetical protein
MNLRGDCIYDCPLTLFEPTRALSENGQTDPATTLAITGSGLRLPETTRLSDKGRVAGWNGSCYGVKTQIRQCGTFYQIARYSSR